MYIKNIAIAGLLSLFMILSACSDSNNGSPYADPVGFSIQLEGVSLVTYENGVYEYDPSGAAPDYVSDDKLIISPSYMGGNLVRTIADFGTDADPSDFRYFTPSVYVRFYDASGNTIPYPEEKSEDGNDGEYRLDWEWIDPISNRKSNLEQHGSDGSWGFHFRADQPGETGVIFKLYRCEGERTISSVGDAMDASDPQRSIRECHVSEERIFEASAPLMILVDDYENLGQDGRYPHVRHFRIR